MEYLIGFQEVKSVDFEIKRKIGAQLYWQKTLNWMFNAKNLKVSRKVFAKLI